MDSLTVQTSDSIVEYAFTPMPDSVKLDPLQKALWKQQELTQSVLEKTIENKVLIAEQSAKTDILIYKFGILNVVLICLVILAIYIFTRKDK